jgi:hypothetical protein
MIPQRVHLVLKNLPSNAASITEILLPPRSKNSLARLPQSISKADGRPALTIIIIVTG